MVTSFFTTIESYKDVTWKECWQTNFGWKRETRKGIASDATERSSNGISGGSLNISDVIKSKEKEGPPLNRLKVARTKEFEGG